MNIEGTVKDNENKLADCDGKQGQYQNKPLQPPNPDGCEVVAFHFLCVALSNQLCQNRICRTGIRTLTEDTRKFIH